MEMKAQRKAQVTYFYAGLDGDMDSHRDIRLDKGIPILLLQGKAGKFFPWVIMTCLGEEKSEKVKDLFVVKHSRPVLWKKYVLNPCSENKLFVLLYFWLGSQEMQFSLVNSFSLR